MLVIGSLHGRTTPAASWEVAASMGAQTRGSFVQRYGCTRCAILRERLGDEQMQRCRELVRATVADLLNCVELYDNHDF